MRMEFQMRKKEPRLVVTFHTTADAMEMERICKAQGAPGRMIPVPREISAGCGLAWCAAPDQEDVIRSILREAGLQQEAVHTIVF